MFYFLAYDIVKKEKAGRELRPAGCRNSVNR
jgi:hypothetical protein